MYKFIFANVFFFTQRQLIWKSPGSISYSGSLPDQCCNWGMRCHGIIKISYLPIYKFIFAIALFFTQRQLISKSPGSISYSGSLPDQCCNRGMRCHGIIKISYLPIYKFIFAIALFFTQRQLISEVSRIYVIFFCIVVGR